MFLNSFVLAYSNVDELSVIIKSFEKNDIEGVFRANFNRVSGDIFFAAEQNK